MTTTSQMSSSLSSRRRAFTIVELLVVISIMGIMVGLLLPAVQSARESSRRVECANNLRNQVLALHGFHAAHNAFPPGRRVVGNVENSWCLEILHYLEQEPLRSRFDRNTPWNGSVNNLAVANTVLPVFRCPSSTMDYPGDTDFGGVMGSSLTSIIWSGAFGNGVFVEVRGMSEKGIAIAAITDGTSHTICLAESADRDPSGGGLWISGFNCFSQDNGGINASGSGEIFSKHRTGANVALADGAIRFVVNSVDPYVVGALCTRSLQEVFDQSAY